MPDLQVGESGELHVSILFVDLVGSTQLAGVMGMEEYAQYARSFESTCLRTCQHFFESRGHRYADDGTSYEVSLVGDELAVFIHTDRPHDDVYQLICLAIALKCAWLAIPLNAERIFSGRPTFELGMGIHSGPLWATRTEFGFKHWGYAINLAKRVESMSREGSRFRLYVSDPAFKLVNQRLRNLVFGPRQLLRTVTPTVGVHELVDSFVDPGRRLPPESLKQFTEVALRAMETNSFDLWIHSCLQVALAARNQTMGPEALGLCRRILSIDPANPVALYYEAAAERERGNLEAAALCLQDLTHHCPTLGDGWLQFGRLLVEMGDLDRARTCMLQARRRGVSEEEAELPRSE